MSFTQGDLPDVEKESLCQSLLDEFGAGRIRVTSKGEMIHGCLLPGGNHSDQTRNPTASLNYKKLTYKCLGCNQSGGLLWFIGTMRGTTGTQARKWLAKETGTDGEIQELAKLLSLFDSLYNEKHEQPPIPKYNPDLLNPWLKIHPYMTDQRHVPVETLMHFKVGYGVIPIGPTESRIMSHRIVLPLFWKGDLVGWQTRRLIDDGTPKYHFSPDFPRDQTIYNYDRQREHAVWVESPMSTLRHFHEVPETEATFGAGISDQQVRAGRMHPRITLCYDNGKAGWEAVQGVFGNYGKLIRPGLGDALGKYSDVRVWFNPYIGGYDEMDRPLWLDPADFDTKTFARLVDEAVPYSLWRPPDSQDFEVYSQALTTTGV